MQDDRMCTCELCRLSRRARRTSMSGSRPQMRKLIEELFNRAMNAEFDLDYNESVLDGSWPQSVEILERSLEKAKAIQASRQ